MLYSQGKAAVPLSAIALATADACFKEPRGVSPPSATQASSVAKAVADKETPAVPCRYCAEEARLNT